MNTFIQIPILTYHTLHQPGNSYSSNDLIAVQEDLKLLDSLGYEILPLSYLVGLFLQEKLVNLKSRKIAALTVDDGSNYDYVDFSHPDIGHIKSFANCLIEYQQIRQSPFFSPTATSFVIASPDARSTLDESCIAGRGQWSDAWWLKAADSGFLDIGNHSWDHTHDSLETVAQKDQIKGNFSVIESWDDATRQIMEAELYITSIIGYKSTRLFAYPYGHTNEFLTKEYFPRHHHIFRAAFTTGGDYMTQNSDRWTIPRFVCGEHWRSSEELKTILNVC